MLTDEIKARIEAALRAGRAAEKEALKVLLGEIQTDASRKKRDLTDDEVRSTAAKICTQYEETVALGRTHGRDVTAFEQTIITLNDYRPKTVSAADLKAHLESVEAVIRTAAVVGQAVGVAMKYLKTQGLTASAEDVKAVVAELRS